MVTYFVVLVTVAWLPQTTLSFSFTRKPEQPMVIVLNNNSTNVAFRWEFTLASGERFSYLNFKRYEKNKGLVPGVTLGYYDQTAYTEVNTTLYSLHANVSNGPSSGYLSFSIKDIMKQIDNKDGSTADARSIDYVYQLEMKIINVRDEVVSDVEMSLLVQVHNFIGPKNETINESEEFNVNCSADGKPSPSLTVVLPNGVEIKGTKTLDVNITAYRNMTGMYKCTAENEVTSAQTKTAWLNVWFPASCAMSSVNVTEENSVTLNISTRGNPSVNDYICTHPNGSRLAVNGVFTFIAQQRDAGTYHCSVYNGVGNRGNCTGYVNVQYSPGMPQTFVAQPANACRGGYINLTCSNSTANPAVSKYFFYNGVKLLGEKGSGFFQVNKTTLGINVFWCVPFNSIGEGKNISVNVTVHENPSILNPRINDATTTNEATPVVENEELEFTFFYNGTRKLNETWKRHDGKPRRGQKFQQVSTYGLNFSLAHRNDSGVYEMIARDDYGCFTVKRFNLSVHYKPESTAIHVIPNKRAFCKGTLIQIKCISKAVPDPEYYFIYHNHEILSKSRFGVFNVTLNTEGNNTYTCVSNNTVGFGKNKSLHIVVKETPKIDGCDNKTMINGVTEGEKVTMMCNISGTEPLNVTWTNGNQVWKNRSLIFEPVNRKNDGTYDVTVSNGNECSEARRSNIQLKVFYKPESTNVIPNKGVFCTGTVIQIKCISKAVPNPEYYFIYHNHEILSKSRFGVFNVTLNTEGNNTYTCVFNNTVGFGENKSSHIVVRAQPQIKNCLISNKNGMSERFRLNEDETANVSCVISGSKRLKTTWTKGAKLLKSTSLDFNSGSEEVSGTNATEVLKTSGLELNSVKREEAGIYTVTVNDEAKECNGDNKTLNIIVCGKYKLHFKLNRLHNEDLKNKASSEYRKLETSCLNEIKKIYQDDTNFCDIQLHSFVRGSVIVNLIFFFDGASNFQPLINIVNKKGVKIDGSNIERDSVKTGYFVPPTSEPPTSEPPPTVIIVIVVVVVVTIIAIIVLIICCRKKKKDSEKEAALTDRDDCGRIPMNEVGRENDALSYSPLQYAKGGPPHADSMDGSRESKNNNTNETDSSRVVQEPAYAAVDASKKTKKKKPGEVLYADLGGFRKSGDEKKGSRNDLVLELQPKGKDTKMPQKYEETMYADIDWMKAQRSDNHGAAADVRAPSNDIHNKVSDSNTSEEEKLNLAQKFSDETTDPTKKKEQEVADKGNKGTAEPGVNELAQPMTKQDSADSFLTTRERNDTTLTAVSL